MVVVMGPVGLATVRVRIRAMVRVRNGVKVRKPCKTQQRWRYQHPICRRASAQRIFFPDWDLLSSLLADTLCTHRQPWIGIGLGLRLGLGLVVRVRVRC